MTIHANASNLLKENINALFNNIIALKCDVNCCYGVFFDAPLHKELKDCRYFAGVEINSTEAKKHTTITIDEGYYTYLDISGSFNEFITVIIDFKEKYIDPSPYEISSLVAFEKIFFSQKSDKFDYFSSKRRIYIKIKRK